MTSAKRNTLNLSNIWIQWKGWNVLKKPLPQILLTITMGHYILARGSNREILMVNANNNRNSSQFPQQSQNHTRPIIPLNKAA